MDLYLVTYDNGEKYEQNYTKEIGIFDDKALIKKYAEENGFKLSEEDRGVEDVYIKTNGVTFGLFDNQEFLFVETFKLNEVKEEEDEE